MRDLSLHHQGCGGGEVSGNVSWGAWEVRGLAAESEGRSERNAICHLVYFQKRENNDKVRI